MQDEIFGKLDLVRGRGIGRRELLKSVAGVVGGVVAAHFLFESNALGAPSMSSQAAQTDNVDAENVTYPSGVYTIQAYLAKPKGEGKHPAIILIHDLRGLTDSFKTAARKFAAEGFVVLAPNMASRVADTTGMTSFRSRDGRHQPDSTLRKRGRSERPGTHFSKNTQPPMPPKFLP